jgi:arylformamidase
MTNVESLSKLVGSMKCVDLAPTLKRGIPRFPTHPHLVIDPTVRHERDGYYCQSISMAEHTGCHVDAPAHIHANMMDVTIETFPVDQLVAPAVIYDFANLGLEAGQTLSVEQFLEYEKRQGVRVEQGGIAIVNFGWLKRHWRTDAQAHFYSRNSPGMDENVARFFAQRGVRAVGADTITCEIPMVDGKIGDDPGHSRWWLPNRILILECLANLEMLPQQCFFIAAPLPIEKGSGSPLRPIALF